MTAAANTVSPHRLTSPSSPFISTRFYISICVCMCRRMEGLGALRPKYVTVTLDTQVCQCHCQVCHWHARYCPKYVTVDRAQRMSVCLLSVCALSTVHMPVSACDAGGLGRCDVVSPHKARTPYHNNLLPQAPTNTTSSSQERHLSYRLCGHTMWYAQTYVATRRPVVCVEILCRTPTGACTASGLWYV